MKLILVIGGLSYNTMIYLSKLPDALPQTIFCQAYHETVGETGAGKALNLARLDFDVTFHALIGEDYYGSIIRGLFAQQEHLTFIGDIDPLGTHRHINLMDNEGGRISIYMQPGTFNPNIDLDRLDELIPQQDYIVLNIENYCREVIPLIQRACRPIWCDIHDYDGANPYHQDFIRAAEYLFMSSDALPEYRHYMEHFIRAGKKLVVCTHGKLGSTALTSDSNWIETPICSEYQQVDTNGAGDAFFAGFLYGYSHSYPIEKCLRMASIVAGLCVTSHELAYSDLYPKLIEVAYKKTNSQSGDS